LHKYQHIFGHVTLTELNSQIIANSGQVHHSLATTFNYSIFADSSHLIDLKMKHCTPQSNWQIFLLSEIASEHKHQPICSYTH